MQSADVARVSFRCLQVRAMVEMLPKIEVVADDAFNSDPADPKNMGPEARQRHAAGETLLTAHVPTPLVGAVGSGCWTHRLPSRTPRAPWHRFKTPSAKKTPSANFGKGLGNHLPAIYCLLHTKKHTQQNSYLMHRSSCRWGPQRTASAGPSTSRRRCRKASKHTSPASWWVCPAGPSVCVHQEHPQAA